MFDTEVSKYTLVCHRTHYMLFSTQELTLFRQNRSN